MTERVPSSESWTCPRCGEAFPDTSDDDGMVTCPRGHRAYAGYLAEAAHLRPRLTWLDDRIAAGDPAPDAETAARANLWAAPGHAAPPASGHGAESRAPQEGPGIQVLLLGLGAVLLIIAGIVFMAVVWDTLGAFGQVTVMAFATLGFAAAAVRLTERLPGTAEGLALVAFGLAVVDVFAAPALGLVPDSWLDLSAALYLPVVACAGATLAVALGHRFALRVWVWLGWWAAAVGAAMVTWYLALALADSELPWAAVAVSVVSVSTVALAAAPHLSNRLAIDLLPMTAAAGLGSLLTLGAWLYWVSDMDQPALVGTLVTTLSTAGAAGLAWRRLPSTAAGRLSGLVAAALIGVAGGLAMLLPHEVDAAWLGVAAGLLGVGLLAVLARYGFVHAGLLGSTALWLTWGLGRLAIASPESSSDPVILQLSALFAVASITWYGVSGLGLAPLTAWPAALAGQAAWLLALDGVSGLSGLSDVPESSTLSLAALLLLAGYLWHRVRPVGSLVWLGPGVTVALIPSAFFCWGAPWVSDGNDQTTGEAAVRLVVVLIAGVSVVAVGARTRLAGLFLPGALALGIVGGAQVWTGLAALTRWFAIGLAGATLFILGARIEWVRRGGREARTFVASLR